MIVNVIGSAIEGGLGLGVQSLFATESVVCYSELLRLSSELTEIKPSVCVVAVDRVWFSHDHPALSVSETPESSGVFQTYDHYRARQSHTKSIQSR